jgi:uncharacterized membrane protein
MAATNKNTTVGRVAVNDVIQGVSQDINVGQDERMISLIGGGALAVFGLSRRSWGGFLLALLGGEVLYSAITGHSHIYQALGKNNATTGWSDMVSVPHEQGFKIQRAVLIDKSPAEIYNFWHNFENLPRFMSHLQSVSVKDGTISHWVAKGFAGMSVEWDAEIINDIPNRLIAWRSLEGAQVPNAGSVHFSEAPYGLGTQVKVIMSYVPPAGKVGELVAHIFGESPDQQIREDLLLLRQIMETGEAQPNIA